MEKRSIHGLGLSTLLRAGDYVVWGQTGAEPLTLTRAFHDAAKEVEGLSCFIGISWGALPDPRHVHVESYCGTAENRRLAASGSMEILPVHYSTLPGLLSKRASVLLIKVAPGRKTGTFSWSMACEYLQPLMKSCRLVIAELDHSAPATGGMLIEASDIDVLVETEASPLLPPASRIEDAVTAAIAHNVAGLVEDGACLQVGLGNLPEAVAWKLHDRRDLSIHSGLINDALAALIAAGVVTNSRKAHRPGESLTGLLAGGADLLRLAADPQSRIALTATSETHDLAIMARLERFTAINSAIEVDLTGQINAETVGGRYLGAVGGGVDFLRGAALSRGGLPITAMPSTVQMPDGRTVSRIVSRLSGPATISRADAGVIVTEHGVADLRGASIEERKLRLRAIAHPDFREDL